MVYNETMKDIIKALNWRYATKVFDKDRLISESDISELKEALRLTPSSFGLQPWKFLIIEDEVLRAELRTVAWNQSAVTDASHFIVFTVLCDMDEKYVDNFLNLNAKIAGVSADNFANYKKQIMNFVSGMDKHTQGEWNTRQAYIALGELLTVCALKEIDACPMEGFDTNKFDEILGLTGTSYTTRVACAIGYRSADDKHAADKKVRFEKNEVISEIK